jgi:GxxExxY protein
MEDGFLHKELTKDIIAKAMKVHSALGPGLLESTYERCLEYELRLAGLQVESQKSLSLIYGEMVIDQAYRLDLLINNTVLIEIKAVSEITETHEAQVLTYLRLTGCRVGLLINFYEKHLKDGIRRFVK